MPEINQGNHEPRIPPGLLQAVEAVAKLEAVPRILEVLCRTTGLGFSAVARVTSERWIACAVRDEIGFGLRAGGELEIEMTFCNEIRQSGQLVVIDNVADDEAYCGHPIPAMYGFQSYISVPVRLPSGEIFGTLCGIDRKPARVNTRETIAMFELFASLIGLQLDSEHRLEVSQTALFDEKHRSELQHQFIAVLGHDLRNPLSAIKMGAQALQGLQLDEKALHIATVIDASASRMAGIINNVLDFARGRLGGGISVSREVRCDMQEVLEQVISETQTAWLDREIHSEIRIDEEVDCDRVRIGQLASNLLANALTHGDPESAVWVQASVAGQEFELSVRNLGEPIPDEILGRLFQPFVRGTARKEQSGLGLGLYISSQIARAHGGTLKAYSSPQETRFVFRMPVAQLEG